MNCIDEKTICFCKKDQISKTAEVFAKEKGTTELSDREVALINYIEKYIHPRFELVDFLKKGIAIHHADLDTFTKRQIEKSFSEKTNLNIIFCTSTLLEGVNLNAQNLFFLAKSGKFNNAKLDKKNLFGRVGRLGAHLQGNIFKFWVEGKSSIENASEEINGYSDEYVVEENKFVLDENKKCSDVLSSYLSKYISTKCQPNFAETICVSKDT